MRNYRKPYKVKKRKSILKNRFFWLGILILLIFSGVFYLIFFHSFFQIKVIEISGNEKVSTESLEDLLQERIKQKILFLPSQSIFLVNFAEIKEEILEDFPRVSETEPKRKLPHTLLLQIKEREPLALFCQADKIFSIDREGIIFESLDPNTTGQNFAILKKEMDREVNLGDKIIEKEQLDKILEVKTKLENQFKILAGEEKSPSAAPAETPVAEEIFVVSEVRFDVKTSEGFIIYFNFDEDLDWQLAKLKAVLEEEVPPERRKDIEYIDLRFGKFAPCVYRD
jgi:cell division protein FtsQ